MEKTYQIISTCLEDTCEMNGCSYVIRLKQNSSLLALASDKDGDLYNATKADQISYTVLMANFCIRQTPGIIQGAWFVSLRNHTVS